MWKSVKCEEVYLEACISIAEAGTEPARHFEFCNPRHRRQGLDRKAPDEVYMAVLSKELGAA